VLWCTFLPDPTASPPRVAFAIGRAVGPAVTRNRVRRRLRVLLAADRAWPPGWYLIGARPAIAERPFDALGTEVAQLRSAIIRASPAPSPPATRADPAPNLAPEASAD